MKVTGFVIPIMFLMACVIALLFMSKYSIVGGNWSTITGYMILLIPCLLGIIIGLYYLFNRR